MAFLDVTVTAALAGAIAMWHLLEKHFLFRDSHYVSVTSGDHAKIGANAEVLCGGSADSVDVSITAVAPVRQVPESRGGA